jgi:hypothetical protein
MTTRTLSMNAKDSRDRTYGHSILKMAKGNVQVGLYFFRIQISNVLLPMKRSASMQYILPFGRDPIPSLACRNDTIRPEHRSPNLANPT